MMPTMNGNEDETNEKNRSAVPLPGTGPSSMADAIARARATRLSAAMMTLTAKPRDWGTKKVQLTTQELACALYEGMPWVQNLAEQCARAYGNAGALTFFDMMGDDVQNFWRGIAKQIIDHSRHWKPNEGSACVLDEAESTRLAALPRVPENGDGATMTRQPLSSVTMDGAHTPVDGVQMNKNDPRGFDRPNPRVG